MGIIKELRFVLPMTPEEYDRGILSFLFSQTSHSYPRPPLILQYFNLFICINQVVNIRRRNSRRSKRDTYSIEISKREPYVDEATGKTGLYTQRKYNAGKFDLFLFYFILFYNFFRKEIALLFAPSLSQKGLMLLDENENFVDSSNLCQLFLSFLFLLFFSFIFSLIVLRKEFMAFLQLFASMDGELVAVVRGHLRRLFPNLWNDDIQ